MPVSFNSPARNLFLLGSTGTTVVSNFFKTIDQSAGTDGVYLPDEIKYNSLDQKYLLAGSATDSSSKDFGWFEKRNNAGTAEWNVRIESTTSGVNTTLRAMELDSNDNLIVVGKTGDIPWIAKYDNDGVIDWQSTSNSADVEYTGVTSDSNGNYYACGSTPINGEATAFVEKFDASGTPGWGKAAFMLGRDVILSKISANNRGEVVAVGYLEDDSSDKGYIVKIDTNTGEVLWDKTLEVFTETSGSKQNVWCQDVYIDSNDQIYVVGRIGEDFLLFNPSGEITEIRSFLIKYTPEGNIIWQKETPQEERIEYFQVKSDGETEQTVVFGIYFDPINADQSGIISKYSKNGDLIWRRIIFSSETVFGQTFGGERSFGGYVSLDADPSFYYVLFIDKTVFGPANTPEQYTFGKISSSGNGLGNFQYTDGTGEIYNYEILNVQDEIGRLSDGSIRNDTSDLITYPFSANKLLFDDLATQVSNKKRQMDGPDSFEYSGSPAIRPADFQELNLLGDVYSGSGDWLDQSGKGNDGVVNGATWNASGWWEFDGVDDEITIPYTPNLAFTDTIMSCESWVYVDSLSSAFSIINKRGNRFTQNTNRPYVFEVNNDGRVRWILDDATTVCDTATGLIQTGQWYHLAATHDGTNAKVYVNGVESVSVSSGTSSLNDTGDVPVRIGWRYQNSGINYSNGRIGEIRVYPRALTAAQVFQNYNATREKYTGVPASTDPGLTSTRTPA